MGLIRVEVSKMTIGRARSECQARVVNVTTVERLVGHIALRCPKEKGAKLEESLRDSLSRKSFAVQKGRSDAGAVDNDHTEAMTGFLLSGFICGQRCKWWSHRPKLTSSVISDVKLIIYIFFTF